MIPHLGTVIAHEDEVRTLRRINRTLRIINLLAVVILGATIGILLARYLSSSDDGGATFTLELGAPTFQQEGNVLARSGRVDI